MQLVTCSAAKISVWATPTLLAKIYLNTPKLVDFPFVSIFTACDSGYSGVNCEQQCTEDHTCDIVSDGCSCEDWWNGNQCTVEISELFVLIKIVLVYVDSTSWPASVIAVAVHL